MSSSRDECAVSSQSECVYVSVCACVCVCVGSDGIRSIDLESGITGHCLTVQADVGTVLSSQQRIKVKGAEEATQKLLRDICQKKKKRLWFKHCRIYHTGNLGKCPGAPEQKGAPNELILFFFFLVRRYRNKTQGLTHPLGGVGNLVFHPDSNAIIQLD